MVEAESNNKRAALEALLFVSAASLSISRLAKVLESPEEEVRDEIRRLRARYLSEGSGLRLIEIGDEVQLGTSPEIYGFVAKLVKEEFSEDLTPASLETLAIVVYRGPIPRAEIDFIRGVNSSYILRTLLIRGLVSREADPRRSNIWLYKPSFELLQLLGITSPAELPEFENLSKKLSDLLQTDQEANNLKSKI